MKCLIYNLLWKMKMTMGIGDLHLHLKILNLTLLAPHNLLLKGTSIAKIDTIDECSSRSSQRRAAPANRFASLSDFNNNEDDDDDEGRQNFFAGGEKSCPLLPPLVN